MTSRGMSVQELLALPVAVSLDDANRALGLGRSLGYAMAKRGEYPCELLRLRRAYRVKRSDLLKILGVSDTETASGESRSARPQLGALKPGGFQTKPYPPLRAV